MNSKEMESRKNRTNAQETTNVLSVMALTPKYLHGIDLSTLDISLQVTLPRQNENS